MRAHKLTLAALAVVAGLSLTACQNDDDGAGQTAPPAGASGASGSSASATPSSDGGPATGGDGSGGGDEKGSGTGGSGSGTEAKAGKCRTDGLKISAIDATIGGDTDGTVAVELKNTSGKDCVISGFAGVDLKTNAGSLSATRTGAPAEPYVLRSGKQVAFGINYPLNETGGSGVRVTGLVVTPPDETTSVTLAWPGAATLPATDGSGSPVKVGPIGSAGQGG
ncbi:DUF4232 domain-containing protein [Streptomyces sp. ITFR-16]|uniref:DUF4232 domain-containing protein n=1 Tax=Streptomyces sp. ITFR-16 TaxID=3075198 RepID=UPI002889D620|nr:DUF4232 domain-containing protein [Streptomyces sp. ITFR-16]WNI23767.1 DUF4232 domain-containing protein [Streptomyces sp. ITFR-16]